MVSTEIPSLTDWGDVKNQDCDAHYAFKVFFGKNINQAIELFQLNFLERALELNYMPEKAFNYYIFAFKEFIESNFIQEDDKPDAASIFMMLIKKRVDSNSKNIGNIYIYLHDLLYDIAFNQKKYDADIDIYGDFKETYKEINSKILND